MYLTAAIITMKAETIIEARMVIEPVSRPSGEAAVAFLSLSDTPNKL